MINTDLQEHKITGAWLTTNRSCNNKCAFCYAQNAIGKDMDIQDAKKCVDYIDDLGINRIVLIGGEPTIYKELIPLLLYIKSKNISSSIVTNGRRFANIDFTKRVINAGISGINISIKGSSEDEYIRNTRCSGFFEMIQGYHNLKETGFSPIVSYVITDNDINNIEELANVLTKNSIDNILFQFVKPVVQPNSPKILSMNDMGKMVDNLYNIMERTSIKYKIEISFPLCLVNNIILTKLIAEDKINTCCHVQAGRGIVFDTDFRILPCNHFIDYHYSDEQVGKMGVEEIKNVFYSEIAQVFRKTASYYPSEICSRCKNWDICGGGCFTRWLFENPNTIIKDL